MVALSFGVMACRWEASGPDFCFLIWLFMFLRYYFTVCPVVPTSRPSERTNLATFPTVFIFLWRLKSHRDVGHSEPSYLSMLWLLSNVVQDVVDTWTGLYHVHKLPHGVLSEATGWSYLIVYAFKRSFFTVLIITVRVRLKEESTVICWFMRYYYWMCN